MAEVPLHNINYDRMKTHSHHQRKIKMEQQNKENLLQHKTKENEVRKKKLKKERSTSSCSGDI